MHVKICGIANETDARAAADAGAELLGFVFYPPSPRYVSPSRAREIVAEIRKRDLALRTVGVFVNEPLETVRAAMEIAQLDLAQLHGAETPTMLQALQPRAYKALAARDAESARALVETFRAAAHGAAPAFLVDAPPAQLPGGNGSRADWTIAREIARAFPILLAGGLTGENVQAAITQVQPWGVDVSSGVERAPGLKDHRKLRAFIARAKGAA